MSLPNLYSVLKLKKKFNLLSLVGWSCIPFNISNVPGDINLGVLYMLALSSLGVYGIIIAGWASNSKYAFLGALRSVAQMISYVYLIPFIILINKLKILANNYFKNLFSNKINKNTLTLSFSANI